MVHGSDLAPASYRSRSTLAWLPVVVVAAVGGVPVLGLLLMGVVGAPVLRAPGWVEDALLVVEGLLAAAGAAGGAAICAWIALSPRAGGAT